MMWWLKVRRTPYLVAAVGAYLTVLALVGENRVPLISFTGVATAAIAAMAPLIIMAAIMGTIASRDGHHEPLACRRVWRGDIGLVVVTAAVCILGAWVLRHTQPFVVEASRNLAGFVGTALIIRAFVSERAAVALTTAAVLVAAAFGHGRRGLHPWAWPLADGANVPAALAAGTLFAAGLVAIVAAHDSGRTKRFA